MKKRLLCIVVMLIFCGSVFFACTGNKEKASEKGKIEQMTQETGKEIANHIRSPIKRAEKVKDQSEDRAKEMMEMINEEK